MQNRPFSFILTAMQRIGGQIKIGAGFAVFWLLSLLPHRVRYQRSAHIPRNGPALLVVNHLSTTETTAVARLVIGHRRFPHFLVMGSLFRLPVVGWLAGAMKQIPVERGSSHAATALTVATTELERGHVVVIYPEGRLTTEPDLRPGPAKSGAARLALAMPDVPVIPIGQWGARPGVSQLLRRRRVDLVVGPPVDLIRWRRHDQAAVPAPEVIADVTAALMRTVTSLVESVRGEPFSPPQR